MNKKRSTPFPNLGIRPVARRILSMLPPETKSRLIRGMIHLEYELPKEVVFKVAETQEELEGAFRLLHDAYVSVGFMRPHPSGMRVTLYHALPSTTTLVAKRDGRVIGTVSIIRDNVLGLPMEKAFDVSGIREQGFTPAEISSLAIAEDYRHARGQILLALCRFLYHYCAEFFGIDCMLIAVNPRHIELYESVILFERLDAKTIDRYDFANGAPAVGAFLNLRTVKNRLITAYGNKAPSRNLFTYTFVADKFAAYRFPDRAYFKISDPVMTPELIRYFFIERTELFASIADRERSVLRKLYEHFPSYRDLIPDSQVVVPFMRTRREIRYEVQCRGQLRTFSSAGACDIAVREVSARGFQGRCSSQLAPGTRIAFSIQVSPVQIATGTAICAWTIPSGRCGFLITEASESWKCFIQYLLDDVSRIPVREEENQEPRIA